MRFIPTTVMDAVLIEADPREDHRGWFERTFCEEEMAKAGLASRFVQHNSSSNHAAGTLRGMHYQQAPHAEVKVITCIRGRIQDVIIDLRPASPTYMKWEGFDLRAGDHRQLYIPEGFAHGYLTLEDGTAVSYLVSTAYTPGAEAGVRWDDPAFGIRWEREVAVISEKDAAWPDVATA